MPVIAFEAELAATCGAANQTVERTDGSGERSEASLWCVRLNYVSHWLPHTLLPGQLGPGTIAFNVIVGVDPRDVPFRDVAIVLCAEEAALACAVVNPACVARLAVVSNSLLTATSADMNASKRSSKPGESVPRERPGWKRKIYWEHSTSRLSRS